jgi:tetratricopeptide (TPR) repeat protein
VIGREIDWPLMQQLAPETLNDPQWLAHCASSAILVRREQNWVFTHDKIRAGILEGLDRAAHLALHRLVAEALETRFANDVTYAARLYHHWHTVGQVDKERVYLTRVAQRYNDQGFPQKAQQMLENSLEHPSSDDPLTGQLIFELARAIKMQGNYERGTLLAQQALQIAEEHGALPLQHSVLGFLGSIAREQGDFAACEAYHQQAFAIARKLEDPTITAKSFVNLAAIKASSGSVEEAEQLFKEGYALAETLDNRLGMALIASNVGVLAKSRGALEEAAQYFERSLALSRKDGYVDLEVQALIGIAEIQVRHGSADSALQSLQTAIELSTQIRSERLLALSYVSMGLHHVHGFEPETLLALRKALRLAKTLHLIPISLLALIGFARHSLRHGSAETAGEIAGFVQADGRLYSFNRYNLHSLITDLGTALDAGTLEQAYQRGATRSLDQWIAHFLDDSGTSPASTSTAETSL